jgi:hypothetical protein
MLYRYNVAQASEAEDEVRNGNQVDLVSPSGDKTSSAAVGQPYGAVDGTVKP